MGNLRSKITLCKESAVIGTENDKDSAVITLNSKQNNASIQHSSTKDIIFEAKKNITGKADEEMVFEAKKKIIFKVGDKNTIEVSTDGIIIKSENTVVTVKGKSLHLDSTGNIQLKSTGKTIKLKTDGAKIIQQAPGIELK